MCPRPRIVWPKAAAKSARRFSRGAYAAAHETGVTTVRHQRSVAGERSSNAWARLGAIESGGQGATPGRLGEFSPRHQSRHSSIADCVRMMGSESSPHHSGFMILTGNAIIPSWRRAQTVVKRKRRASAFPPGIKLTLESARQKLENLSVMKLFPGSLNFIPVSHAA